MFTLSYADSIKTRCNSTVMNEIRERNHQSIYQRTPNVLAFASSTWMMLSLPRMHVTVHTRT